MNTFFIAVFGLISIGSICFTIYCAYDLAQSFYENPAVRFIKLMIFILAMAMNIICFAEFHYFISI